MFYSKIQSFMKKDIIIGLLFVSNLISGFYLVKPKDKSENTPSAIEMKTPKKSEDSKIDSRENTKISESDNLELISKIYIEVTELSISIISKDYDWYKRKSPNVLKDLDLLISRTQNEKELEMLCLVQQTIKGRPTEKEIGDASSKMGKYYDIVRDRIRKQKEYEFYKNK